MPYFINLSSWRSLAIQSLRNPWQDILTVWEICRTCSTVKQSNILCVEVGQDRTSNMRHIELSRWKWRFRVEYRAQLPALRSEKSNVGCSDYQRHVQEGFASCTQWLPITTDEMQVPCYDIEYRHATRVLLGTSRHRYMHHDSCTQNWNSSEKTKPCQCYTRFLSLGAQVSTCFSMLQYEGSRNNDHHPDSPCY